jgi:DNA-binding MarR family transcriptional regulator
LGLDGSFGLRTRAAAASAEPESSIPGLGISQVPDEIETHMAYPDKSLNRSTLHLLYRASQCASNAFESEIEAMTPRQFAVLAALEGEEGVSQATLTKRTGIDRSTLSEVVDRLLRKGLIARRPNARDRRAYSLRLTPKGRQQLLAVRPAVERIDEHILSLVPVRHRQALMQALLGLIKTCESRL